METENKTTEYEPLNFIEQIIEEHNRTNRFNKKVHTRFPPEPNGYLHIGHAKSICLNFGLAEKYNGLTNLRFDDTNPETEDVEYVNAIEEDVKWLGFDWQDRKFFASDYFEQLYQYAVQLIRLGKAYVDDQTAEEISNTRGTPTIAGKESPYRNRSIEENLALFEAMKRGEVEEGAKVLRAKIDMASPNMHMRDPVIYRIKKTPHHRTGTKWCIYPMYDFAHCLSDAIEGITHSICTLEFEVHRPLYDWILDQLGTHHPQQIEFARLNLTYTVMSKRKLKILVEQGYVNGWDDPRMPTISGLRRRGYTPEAIRNFAQKIGVSRRDTIVDIALLEFSVREHLNKICPRVMAVLNPLKVIITNYPENQTENLITENNPEDETAGNRTIPFSREIWIERDDFMENPPKGYFRLTPKGMVRLKSAYIIQCEEVIKDREGNIIELHCRYFENSKSGNDTSGLKVKGTIHWVSVAHALPIEVRLYDRLFEVEEPEGHEGKEFTEFINPNSLQILPKCFAEPSLAKAKVGDKFQFQRLGYFCVDKDSTPEKLVFNRTITLKDTWAKEQKKNN
ncbi:MAG: glutamine--tRNA ligase/YqeY domain fusion protein [Microscillaceae bacterium]|nr:glutamine--tRNA ligase/YqeY domain fusion protein [Microscillaceae bacterium]MDW8461962.1 glutamine--tRNA ligase/YqeY domain fusion protein [Cytophagales bacterium]